NAMVEAVGDDQVGRCRGIDAYPVREVQIGRRRRAALTAESEPAGAGDRVDRAADHFTNPSVVGVGDEQVARLVDGDPGRVTQQRTGGGSTVTAKTGLSGRPRHRGDRVLCEIDGANDIIKGVGDVEAI